MTFFTFFCAVVLAEVFFAALFVFAVFFAARFFVAVFFVAGLRALVARLFAVL